MAKDDARVASIARELILCRELKRKAKDARNAHFWAEGNCPECGCWKEDSCPASRYKHAEKCGVWDGAQPLHHQFHQHSRRASVLLSKLRKTVLKEADDG